MKDMWRLFLSQSKDSVPPLSPCFSACRQRIRWIEREGVPPFAPLEFTAPSSPHTAPSMHGRERLGAMDLLAEFGAGPGTP